MKFFSAKLILLAFVSLFLNLACSSFPVGRSPSSGYSSYSDSDFREVSLDQIRGTPNSTQIRTVSKQEGDQSVAAMQRKNLESNLNTSEERKHYVRYKPYMNEYERMEYLGLEDVYARERWIQAKGFSSTHQRYNRSIASLIEQNDISVGMEKEAVRDSWGDPDFVEVSGNPEYENERWRFSLPVSTPEGYQIEERIVYFEKGRVAGWSSR